MSRNRNTFLFQITRAYANHITMNNEDRTLATINALLYIINKIGSTIDIRVVYKILYFGERDHLAKYGSSITEDNFLALSKGPVPQLARGIIQSFSDKGAIAYRNSEFTEYFNRDKKFHFSGKKEFDEDELSLSALKSLDLAITQYQDFDFESISKLSHDGAWKNTPLNKSISFFDIAKEGGASKDHIDYMFEMDRFKNGNLVY